MKGSTRYLLLGGVAIALTTLFWPKRAPDVRAPHPAMEHAEPAPSHATPVPPVPPVVDAAARPIDTAHASEAALMDEARVRLEGAPDQALALVEEADRRFGAAQEARRLLEIEALVKLERIGQSHAKAAQFYAAFPDSQAKGKVEQLTGYHPRPWGPGQ